MQHRISITSTVLASVVLAGMLLVACNAGNAVQKAVDLVPVALPLIDTLDSAVGDSSVHNALGHVKEGLNLFATSGRQYLSAPTGAKFATLVGVVDSILADFDKLLPGLPPRAKVAFTVADASLHLIQMVLNSSTDAPKMAHKVMLPSHVDQVLLRQMAKDHGIELAK